MGHRRRSSAPGLPASPAMGYGTGFIPQHRLSMNRQERVEAVAACGRDGKAATGEPASAVFGTIAGTLTKEESMQLVSFSRFPVGEHVASTGRNLAAGAELPISLGQSVKFAAANAVKDAVKGP